MTWRLGLLAPAILVLCLQAADARSQEPDPVTAARGYLSRNAGRFGLGEELADLLAVSVGRSLTGNHVRFQQTLNGVPVFGGFITVGLPDGPSPPPLVVNRYRPGAGPATAGARLTAEEAAALAQGALGVRDEELRGGVTVEPVYFGVGQSYVRAWQVVVPAIRPLGSWLVVLRADNGRVLLQRNLIHFDSGSAFDPNPAKSSGGSIPPPTNCSSAGAEALLSAQYQTKTLLGIQASQNQLKGQHVDMTAPGIIGGYKAAGQADEPSRNYAYLCTDDRFEEVMVYYHVDLVQRKMQSLGFSGDRVVVERAVPAHAHYFDECNAFYDPVDHGIHFGDSAAAGCSDTTDSAEDADVIVHEFGHAIQDAQVPAWGFGPAFQVEQAGAMGEGFGDFLTGAMFGDPCLGEWFNIGRTNCAGLPGLRNMDNTKHYPEDFNSCRPPGPPQPAEPHCAGLIWGGALWDIVEALGNNQAARDAVLKLVLASHFYLDPYVTFAEAAAAIRIVDTILYGGSHVGTIDAVFSARGISDAGPVTDFPYAYVRIRHASSSDLDMQIKVGSAGTPVCSINSWDPGGPSFPDLWGYEDLSTPPGSACAPHLPPRPSQPWLLEIRDVTTVHGTGTVEEFEIVLPGPERCVGTDVPLLIPDGGGFVYSSIDCTNVQGPYPASDLDGDGFGNDAEVLLGTSPLDPCGPGGWPADLSPDNVLNIADMNSFLFPLRPVNDGHGFFYRFGHPLDDDSDTVIESSEDPPAEPGVQSYNVRRWNLQQPPHDPATKIDIGDLNALNPAVATASARPPMFGGQPAFFTNGGQCLFPP
jgi:Zn-dependent metalloprotease